MQDGGGDGWVELLCLCRNSWEVLVAGRFYSLESGLLLFEFSSTIVYWKGIGFVSSVYHVVVGDLGVRAFGEG